MDKSLLLLNTKKKRHPEPELNTIQFVGTKIRNVSQIGLNP